MNLIPLVEAMYDATAELCYMVLPQHPAGTDDWSEDDLTALFTRDFMNTPNMIIGILIRRTAILTGC
jgi:hypothetical protein